MIIVILLAWYVFVIWAVQRSAKKRGRDGLAWGFTAAFIGLFAYIPLWIMGTTDAEYERLAAVEEAGRLKMRAELRDQPLIEPTIKDQRL